MLKKISEENIFVPKYLGLIVNGVVVYDVNWLVVTPKEVLFMNQGIKEHPIVSIILDNLNSLLIIFSLTPQATLTVRSPPASYL